MGGRTWPEPTETDRDVARGAMLMQAEAAGVDTATPEFQKFVDHMVEVAAEKSAEIRWLQSFLQPK